jgi:hypothetical protein
MISLEEICTLLATSQSMKKMRRTMDDDGSPVKENAGNIIRMWCIFIACKETVENHSRVWKSSGLNG